MSEEPKKNYGRATVIRDLPDLEFLEGGMIKSICQDAGYWWHAVSVVSSRDAWDMSLGEFVQTIKRPKIKTKKEMLKEFVENKKWGLGALWWDIRQPQMMISNVIFVLLMLFSCACFFSAYLQILDLLNR